MRDVGVRHTADADPDTQDFLPGCASWCAITTRRSTPSPTTCTGCSWRRCTRRGYEVAFSGTAADELFTGYYDHHLLLPGGGARRSRLRATTCAAWQRARRADRAQSVPAGSRPLRRRRPASAITSSRAPRARGYLRARRGTEPFAEERFTPDLLRNRMLNELFHEAVPVILHEDDLNAMYYSIENRSPVPRPRAVRVRRHDPDPPSDARRLRARPCCATRCAASLPTRSSTIRRKVGFNAPISRLPRPAVDARCAELPARPDSPIFELVRRDAHRAAARTAHAAAEQPEQVPVLLRQRAHLPRGVRVSRDEVVRARASCPTRGPTCRSTPSGVCNACRDHGTSGAIDWARAGRGAAATSSPTRERARRRGYDCLIPVCGGKDSTWQIVKCLELGLQPARRHLAAAGAHRDRPAQPRQPDRARRRSHRLPASIPKVERKLHAQGVRALRLDRASPMHMALFAIPLTLAVRFRIPLVVWGENSAFEYGGADEAHTGFALDARLAAGPTASRTAPRRADWVGDELTAKDLTPYFGPRTRSWTRPACARCSSATTCRWDPQETCRVAARAWLPATDEAPRTGYYDYRRHRRRLHLHPPLDEVVQVRLHAAVRQPVAGDPQRPHHARARRSRSCASAATRRRTRTSPRSALLPASPRRRFF